EDTERGIIEVRSRIGYPRGRGLDPLEDTERGIIEVRSRIGYPRGRGLDPLVDTERWILKEGEEEGRKSVQQ
ncbi:hypothetical protein, partial [Thermogemmatispora onikobensis]|uniref:hypothetical protein n=1 Tax=Thermogemmatispora onikobensis TaxID=732234 RepID=UPI001C404E40